MRNLFFFLCLGACLCSQKADAQGLGDETPQRLVTSFRIDSCQTTLEVTSLLVFAQANGRDELLLGVKRQASSGPPFFVLVGALSVSLFLIVGGLVTLIGNLATFRDGNLSWGWAGVFFGATGSLISLGIIGFASTPTMALPGVAFGLLFGGLLTLSIFGINKYHRRKQKEHNGKSGLPLIGYDAPVRKNDPCGIVLETYANLLASAKNSRQTVQSLQDLEKKYAFCFRSKKGRSLLRKGRLLGPTKHRRPARVPPPPRPGKGRSGFVLLEP